MSNSDEHLKLSQVTNSIIILTQSPPTILRILKLTPNYAKLQIVNSQLTDITESSTLIQEFKQDIEKLSQTNFPVQLCMPESSHLTEICGYEIALEYRILPENKDIEHSLTEITNVYKELERQFITLDEVEFTLLDPKKIYRIWIRAKYKNSNYIQMVDNIDLYIWGSRNKYQYFITFAIPKIELVTASSNEAILKVSQYKPEIYSLMLLPSTNSEYPFIIFGECLMLDKNSNKTEHNLVKANTITTGFEDSVDKFINNSSYKYYSTFQGSTQFIKICGLKEVTEYQFNFYYLQHKFIFCDHLKKSNPFPVLDISIDRFNDIIGYYELKNINIENTNISACITQFNSLCIKTNDVELNISPTFNILENISNFEQYFISGNVNTNANNCIYTYNPFIQLPFNKLSSNKSIVKKQPLPQFLQQPLRIIDVKEREVSIAWNVEELLDTLSYSFACNTSLSSINYKKSNVLTLVRVIEHPRGVINSPIVFGYV